MHLSEFSHGPSAVRAIEPQLHLTMNFAVMFGQSPLFGMYNVSHGSNGHPHGVCIRFERMASRPAPSLSDGSGRLRACMTLAVTGLLWTVVPGRC